MTNTADERRANLLEKVTAYISKHTINDVTSDDEAFFFGLNYNENGELDIGDGTKEHRNLIAEERYAGLMDDITELLTVLNTTHQHGTTISTKNHFIFHLNSIKP